MIPLRRGHPADIDAPLSAVGGDSLVTPGPASGLLIEVLVVEADPHPSIG